MGSMRTKLMEASMALLQAAPEEQLKIVVLNKSLFYMDLFALRWHGKTITGEKYVALKQGPVVENYPDRIVRALEAAGLAQQLSEGASKPMRLVKHIEQFEFLDQRSLKVAEFIGKALSKFGSTMLSNYSHDNPGWEMAFAKGTGREINMRIAMQQLSEVEDEDEDDVWLSAPPEAELLAEAETAHTATKVWE